MNKSFVSFLVLLLVGVLISSCAPTEEAGSVGDAENCGEADFSVIELKSSAFGEVDIAPEAKKIYNCMNKHLKDCSKAYFTSTGDANIKFSIDGKEGDKCLLSMDYGEVKREDQKKYANTYLNCKFGPEMMEELLEKKELAYPTLLIAMALLSTQKDDTTCTGTMKGIGKISSLTETKSTEAEEEVVAAPTEEKFLSHEILPISEVISNRGSCYGKKNCLDNLNSDNGNYIQWVACAQKYAYDTPTTFAFNVDDNDKVTSANLNIDLTRSGEDAYASVKCLNERWMTMAEIKTRFKPDKGKEYSWDVPVECFDTSKVYFQITRTGNNCWGVDYANLEVYRGKEIRETERITEKVEESTKEEGKARSAGTFYFDIPTDISVGDEFKVKVMLDAKDVRSAVYRIYPACTVEVEYVKAEEGSLFVPLDLTFTPVYDSSQKLISIFQSAPMQYETISGKGDIAIITFKAVKEGECPLHVIPKWVYGEEGEGELSYETVKDKIVIGGSASTTEEESSLDSTIKTTSANSDIGCLMIKGILGGEPHKETSIGDYDIKATDNEIEVRKGSSLVGTVPIEDTNSIKDGSNTLWFVNDNSIVYIALNPIENTVNLGTRFSGTRSGESVEYEITEIDTGWEEVHYDSDRHSKDLREGEANVFGGCAVSGPLLLADGAFFYLKEIVSEEEAKLLILMK